MGAAIQGREDMPIPRLGRRMREQIFQRALWAVEKLIPEAGDLDGGAAGRLAIAEIAGACGLSRKAVRRSLAFLRTWRVLWLRYAGSGAWEIRFQRRLVKGFVLAAALAPAELPRFLAGHRRKREAVAPRQSVRLIEDGGVAPKRVESLSL